MGAVCGKEKSDNFTSPGRPLGSAPPPQPKTAAVPANRVVGGPPRILGGGPNPAPSPQRDDQRERLAAAAEARANAANKSTGKLGAQLAQQKKQTRNDTLNQLSTEERQHRAVDFNTQSREHN